MSRVPDYDSDDFMILLVVITIGIGNIALRAWAVTLAWHWFAVPMGAPELPISAALAGLLLVGGGVASGAPSGEPTPPERLAHMLYQSVAIAITLGIVWGIAQIVQVSP